MRLALLPAFVWLFTACRGSSADAGANPGIIATAYILLAEQPVADSEGTI